MENLKEIKNRIYSVSSIMKITSAMEMVAASKLRKTKKILENVKKYNIIINNIYNKISYKNDIKKYLKKDKILLIIISSNKGLCGSFNNLVIKKLLDRIKKYYNYNLSLVTFGKIVKNIISKDYIIYKDYSDFLDKIIYNKENIDVKINNIIKKFIEKKYDLIELIYTKYNNNSSQEVVYKNLIPIYINYNNKNLYNEISNYIIEPNLDYLLKKVFIKTITSNFIKCIIESSVSENLSRMITMHKATKNALDIKNNLISSYNKIRQEVITNQILEVMNGSGIFF